MLKNGPIWDKWVQLWRESDAKGDPLPRHQELVAAYSQSHRHYHNLTHIAECLAEFDAVRHFAIQPSAVEWAIWYHDAVHDARAQDNEEQSADLAQRCLCAVGLNESTVRAVVELVLATKTHVLSQHPDACLLIDVDLSILGKPTERFWEYEAQIRREYAWVSEDVFVSKRAELLERLLTREHIYGTDWFFRKYETSARTNLKESLHRLKHRAG